MSLPSASRAPRFMLQSPSFATGASRGDGLDASVRLEALTATGLLEREAPPAFDRLSRLAARVLGAPVALVSLVASDRQCFAGACGLDEPWATLRQMPITYSFCRHVVAAKAPVVIPDTWTDDRVRLSPTTTELGFRSYLGVPLCTAEGYVLGALCVLDRIPRGWSDDDVSTLEDLAQAVMAEIEARTARRLLEERDAALNDLMATTTELVCACGTDGRITYVNGAWERALGYTAIEAHALRPVDLVVPEQRAAYMDTARRLMNGETVDEYEAVLVARDGHRVVCRGRASAPMRDGRCVGTRAVYQDVTAERAADVMRARLVGIIEATPDFVGMTDAGGRVLYLNRAGRRLLGLQDSTPLEGLHSDQFHPTGALESLMSHGVPTAIRDGRWAGESVLRSIEGEEIPVSIVIVAQPALPGDEAPFYLSTVMRDLRERVAAERARAQERAFVDLVLESMTEGVVACDADGRLRMFNRATRAFHGLPAEPLHPTEWAGWYSLFRADGVTPLPTEEIPLHRALRGEHLEEAEIVVAPSAGRARVVRCSGGPLADAEGQELGAVVTMRDVTDRVHAEAALRTSEARFRGVLESLSAAAICLDVDGRITFANDAFLVLTGWSRDEVLGADWFERFVPSEHDGRESLRGALRRGEAPPHQVRALLRRDGTTRLISWDNVTLTDPSGVPVGVACVGRDETEAARVRELKDQLIATASHELRSPLGAIRGALQLLTRQVTLPEGRPRELVMMAVRNTDRLLRLVNDLLDIERVESGVLPMSPAAHDARTLLQQTLETLGPTAEVSGISLAVDAPASPEDVTAWADRDRIDQVLTNLVGNAIKFSPAGGRVTISAARDGRLVHFAVSDQGRGIPADQLERIFNRFEQVYVADASTHGGAGLGLAICRAIVEQHGGRIWAESTPGAGSQFHFTLLTAESALAAAG